MLKELINSSNLCNFQLIKSKIEGNIGHLKLWNGWVAKTLMSHTFFVEFWPFKREFLRNHSVYQDQIFRDNWNCYALSIFRVAKTHKKVHVFTDWACESLCIVSIKDLLIKYWSFVRYIYLTLSRIVSNFSSDLIKDRVLSWNKYKNIMSSKSMYSVGNLLVKTRYTDEAEYFHTHM